MRRHTQVLHSMQASSRENSHLPRSEGGFHNACTVLFEHPGVGFAFNRDNKICGSCIRLVHVVSESVGSTNEGGSEVVTWHMDPN